jgi:hypothetical protein
MVISVVAGFVLPILGAFLQHPPPELQSLSMGIIFLGFQWLPITVGLGWIAVAYLSFKEYRRN